MKKRLALVEIFHHREPRFLISGQTISGFGDGVANVALTLLVLDITHHSVSKLSLFAAARMIRMVAFLLIGGVVDRFSRRLLLLLSDLSRAVLTGAVVVLIVTGTLHYFELLIFAFLFGTFDALFMPAITAFTPEIVPEDLLGTMNAVRPRSNSFVGNMLDPAAGDPLAAWSTSFAPAVDGATFVASAFFLLLMHPTPTPARSEGTSMLDEIRIGLRYVRRTTWIWTTLAAVALPNALVFVPMSVLLPYYLLHNLHTSREIVGYLFATFGLAGTLGAIFARSMKTPRHRIRVMWTIWSIWSIGSLSALIMGVATRSWEVFLVPVISAPTMYIGNVIWESMVQTEVPRELLGRVSSVDWFVSLGISPVWPIVAEFFSSRHGSRTTSS